MRSNLHSTSGSRNRGAGSEASRPSRRACRVCRAGSGLFAALLAAIPVAALNPVHEASYNLLPRGKFSAPATFSIAGITASGSTDFWQVPMSLVLEASPKVELGGGLKTQWGGAADDHVPFLVFGAKYQVEPATSLQADLLLGANRGFGKGFSLAVHHRMGHARRIHSRFAGRLGFMDALVRDDALMAMEAAWYPAFNLARPLTLEFGLIASSQTRGFDDYFAFDFQPALHAHIGRESAVVTAVAIGLAGERREDLRVKVAVLYGI
jgi:hypothetical protein